MKLGIEKTLELLGDVQNLVVDGVKFVKTLPFGIGTLTGVFKVVGDVKDVIEDAPGAWPELHEVDADEAGKLGSAGYTLVKNVVAAVLG